MPRPKEELILDFDMVPSKLPDIDPRQFVAADTETSGLHPDDGARVCTFSLAWHAPGEPNTIIATAFPFRQGLWGKPEDLERADFGWYQGEPVQVGEFKNGKPKFKKPPRRKYTAEEKLAMLGPDPNLGESEWRHLLDWLRARRGLAWHNALFDVVVTDAGTPDWPGCDLLPHTAWDTMLAQRVLDPQHLLGLKPTTERLFGIPADERDELKEHLKSRRIPTGGGRARYDLADWNVMRKYAAVDTADTIRLARLQWERFNNGEAEWSRMNDMMDRMATLTRMEQRGIPYRAAESLQWAEKMEARLAEMRETFPFNPTGPQAVEYFFGVGYTKRDKPCLGLKPVKTTNHGAPSLDAEVLKALVDRDVPWAPEYYEYGLTEDAVSRYYRGYAEATGADGRLRTRFRQTGTRSGRLSCERVNLQAIPHDHRLLASGSEILGIAPSPRVLIDTVPGFVVWHMDLAQAELRVAALEAQCERMLQILREDRDPHGETAIGLGLTQGKNDPAGMDWYKARSVIGKRSNFSLIFGIGPKKFREDLRKTSGTDFGIKKVTEIHHDWNDLYPEFKRKINFDMRLAERDGWTKIRGSIRRYYTDLEMGVGKDGRRLQYNDLHKAFNQRVQGQLGEFGQEWMVRVDNLLLENGVDDREAGLLLQIHDALVVMVPEGADELVHQSAQIARDMWVEWFPGVPGEVDVDKWHKEG